MKPIEYQERRQQLLARIDKLREIRDDLASRDPRFMNGLPVEVRQKMLLLDRESVRLRNPDLTVAFVGGFSAGKSSLVNAFLGRYLLPESTKVTTAVPTFVRTTTEAEGAELHYLNKAEVERLDDLYRNEIASLFGMPELKNAPYSTVLEKVKPLASEGRGHRLVDQFQVFYEQRRARQVDVRGLVHPTSIEQAQDKIRDETEAMFLDRVVLRIQAPQLPQDVVLVDLPGISVPNPRHREITFRFVKEEAHALVFVLMATRLFDKDEIEIVELVRSGDSRIAEKTFWCLNRWDSLSAEQQRQTSMDFENKMREFAIPNQYQSFRTNALHGLLGQLSLRCEPNHDPALQRHMKDYEEALNSRYGGSHETALRESQVSLLRDQVLAFLNDRFRETTLCSAAENAQVNFALPLLQHLRRAKEADDALLLGDLKRQEKQEVHQRVNERFAAREADLKKQLREMRADVAERRSTILANKTEDLLKILDGKIDTGSETDAYDIYLEIIAESELRRYPYHFEIEMRIVDKLNTLMKREFRDIVRTQAREVIEEYANRLEEILECFRTDVNYDNDVIAPFDQVINDGKSVFYAEVDGQVKSIVGTFDKLLVYIPPAFFWLGGNEVLYGLEKAARLGSEIINDPKQKISRDNFKSKTEAIRKTLKSHYIPRVRAEHERIAKDIPGLIISKMQEIEKRLLEVMQTKYRPALETIMSRHVEEEFASRKKDIEERSRRFRHTIEQIEQINSEIHGLVADLERGRRPATV